MKIYDIVLKVNNNVYSIRGIKAYNVYNALMVANCVRVKHGIMGYAHLMGWGEAIDI